MFNALTETPIYLYRWRAFFTMVEGVLTLFNHQ
jgi:hypothetical protein